ncbi:MAG: bifunctional folylpolyglutamate synthase/dihydrofolate synthase [Gammaproteobacteria bacterium]|nr:bifunctional folylpolyglutamate synthase/dihydrofolate synthase [Gammaproteobacteria bacterium]
MSRVAPAESAALEDWLAWLEHLHPQEIDLGLDRVLAVARRAGVLEHLPTIITVAGTNGKGSVVATLAAIYSAAGYRTGAYTSPHLIKFNERIRIDGECASDQVITRALAHVESHRYDTSLTYFEATTLAAMQVFLTAKVEVAVLEVGLGGRLDAVNCWDTDCAIITSVAVDHESWLGNDRNTIGAEKVAVARAGKPLILADTDPPPSLRQHADSIGALAWCWGIDYLYERRSGAGTATDGWSVSTPLRQHRLPLPALPGDHQLGNAAAAIAAVDALEDVLPVTPATICATLPDVNLPGRLQSQRERGVEVLLDVAHNPAAAAALAASIATAQSVSGAAGKQGSVRRTHAVAAIMADKAVTEIIEHLLPLIDYWYCARLSLDRALPPEELAAVLQQSGVSKDRISIHDTVAAALDSAVSAADDAATDDGAFSAEASNNKRDNAEHLVLVFGSFFTVSDVMSRPTPD